MSGLSSVMALVILGIHCTRLTAALTIPASFDRTTVSSNNSYIFSNDTHNGAAGFASSLYNDGDQWHKYSKHGWHPTSERLTTYDHIPGALVCDLSAPGGAPTLEAYSSGEVIDALVGAFYIDRDHGHFGQNTKSSYMINHGLNVHLFLDFTVEDKWVSNNPDGNNPRKYWVYKQKVTLNNATINLDLTPTAFHTCKWLNAGTCSCLEPYCPGCSHT